MRPTEPDCTDRPEPTSTVERAEQPLPALTPLAVLGYLSGNRRCICAVANCRHGLLLGAILVTLAGFAREYDGEDLLHEPWHLLIPHAASFVTSFILFVMLRLTGIGRWPEQLSFRNGYARLLSLYWMTAPLALVYAVPVERWMSGRAATQTNLWLLAIVAGWRVALITRAILVAFGARPVWKIVVMVLLFGDGVMLLALWLLPIPVLQFMGGVRMTDSESLIQATSFLLQAAGYLALPILLIAWLFPSDCRDTWRWKAAASPTPITPATWIGCSMAFCLFLVIMPGPQAEQRLRRQVETQMASGHIEDAIGLMRQHHRSDFPPQWSPPPRVALPRQVPPLPAVLEVILQDDTHDWVRDEYIDKLRRVIPAVFFMFRWKTDRSDMVYLELMDRIPFEQWHTTLPSSYETANLIGQLIDLRGSKDLPLKPTDVELIDRVLKKLQDHQESGTKETATERH
jgi:hypothetical protein